MKGSPVGDLILTADRTESLDSRATGLNNNVLVLGGSGSGKSDLLGTLLDGAMAALGKK